MNIKPLYSILATALLSAIVVPLASAASRASVKAVPAACAPTGWRGGNLRHNVNAGGVTLEDTDNNYIAGTPTLGVTGAGYTNNDLSANTATTLFDIDSTLDQVAVQSLPNNGSLAATGRLGLDVTTQVGFDIYSTVRNGATIDNEAYAVLSAAGGTARLYEINLTAGKAILCGAFAGENAVVDLAIPPGQR